MSLHNDLDINLRPKSPSGESRALHGERSAKIWIEIFYWRALKVGRHCQASDGEMGAGMVIMWSRIVLAMEVVRSTKVVSIESYIY